jgi:hypothetical protein
MDIIPPIIQYPAKIKNNNHIASSVILLTVIHHTAIPTAMGNKIIAAIIINKILKIKPLS